MRVRTDHRRQVILEKAAQLFLDQGFERTSMSQIAQAIGGSKSTLYGYFSSKEVLFQHTVIFKISAQLDPVIKKLMTQIDAPPQQVLYDIGCHFLNAILTPEAIAFKRLIISQIPHQNLEKIMFNEQPETGPEFFTFGLKTYLQNKTEDGFFEIHNLDLAVKQLISLYVAETGEGGVFPPIPDFSPAWIEQAVQNAVLAFLKIYQA